MSSLFQSIHEALKDSGGPFICGPNLTIADFGVIQTLDIVESCYPKLEHNACAIMRGIREKAVKAYPGLGQYLKSRPKVHV